MFIKKWINQWCFCRVVLKINPWLPLVDIPSTNPIQNKFPAASSMLVGHFYPSTLAVFFCQKEFKAILFFYKILPQGICFFKKWVCSKFGLRFFSKHSLFSCLVNCWFGSRWFGFLESPKMKGIGILGRTPIRIPNHRAPNQQVTIRWFTWKYA